MARPRLVFLGSPAFAVPSLRAAHELGDIPLVLTQPDRPSGRGRRMEPTAVRAAAEELGLPVRPYVPRDRREVTAQLQALRCDVLLVVAFGHILKPAMLSSARCGAVNVHASLLPRWRGVSPVEQALLAGDRTTGVTLMQLDEGVDTGPILATRSVAIGPETTRVTLLDTLAEEGAALVRESLLPFLRGDLQSRPQPEEGACYAPRLDKSMGRLDWRLSAAQLERQVRAFFGWPGCTAVLEAQQVKVHASREVEKHFGEPPGTLVVKEDGVPVVVCGQGALELVSIQFPGKRALAARELVRTGHLRGGMRFEPLEEDAL